jgi:hypothetical protein
LVQRAFHAAFVGDFAMRASISTNFSTQLLKTFTNDSRHGDDRIYFRPLNYQSGRRAVQLRPQGFAMPALFSRRVPAVI